jgi:hypothetical protein
MVSPPIAHRLVHIFGVSVQISSLRRNGRRHSAANQFANEMFVTRRHTTSGRRGSITQGTIEMAFDVIKCNQAS